MELMSSLSLPTIRRRRNYVQKFIENIDSFNKATDEVLEEKKTTGGIISGISFIIIVILIFMQLNAYIFGEDDYNYKFSIDTNFSDHPYLELDMVVATSCSNLIAHFYGSLSEQFTVGPTLKKDPTRFDFTEKELYYWEELKKVHRQIRSDSGTHFNRLEKMAFVSQAVEEGLKSEADGKLLDQKRKNKKKKAIHHFEENAAIFFVSNGINVLHIVASGSQNMDSKACRIHGRVQVNKIKGDNIVVSLGSEIGIENLLAQFSGIPFEGNTSHRIERLNFGPRIFGAITPLAGTEQISLSGKEEYHYFLNIVPTKIYHNGIFGGHTLVYQYSVTFTKKVPKNTPDSHTHAGITIHYDFAPTVIEVRRVRMSILQLVFRICSAVGGIFATSSLLNGLIVYICDTYRKFIVSGADLLKTTKRRENLIFSM